MSDEVKNRKVIIKSLGDGWTDFLDQKNTKIEFEDGKEIPNLQEINIKMSCNEPIAKAYITIVDADLDITAIPEIKVNEVVGRRLLSHIRNILREERPIAKAVREHLINEINQVMKGFEDEPEVPKRNRMTKEGWIELCDRYIADNRNFECMSVRSGEDGAMLIDVKPEAPSNYYQYYIYYPTKS